MAKDICKLCSSEIKKGFMDKIDGTFVFVKEGESKKKVLVCSNCQKEYGDKLVDKVS